MKDSGKEESGDESEITSCAKCKGEGERERPGGVG